jgi:polysaccharide deacetylase family protein (PEP-CTERM system associated)
MAAPLTFSLDLEDHRADRTKPGRYPLMTRKILDFLDELGVRGTVFTVGEVAEEEPDLVREVTRRGHEIAFHSYYHRPLTRETRARFEEETRAGKALLEDLTGGPVSGFRAPVFSLTNKSLWAVDVLQELGFAYSSSVLPAHHPLYGLPGAPDTPFRWANGLIEIPVSVARIGPWTLPYLGGIYLRYLPQGIIARLRDLSSGKALWTYCHPYDFDAEEPFARIRDTALWASILLWFNRRGSFAKMRALLAQDVAPPFAEQIAAGRFAQAPTLDVSAFG